jgi:hypothetical protein
VKGTIEVYSLNTKKRGIIQHYTGTDKPVSIALIPSRGEMFVALESTDHTHMDKQSMSGHGGHHHVIEGNLSARGPFYFAVDEQAGFLYWSDGANKNIEICDFNGIARRKFVKSSRKPGPLALINGDLYWTSIDSRTIQWRNRNVTGPIKKMSIEKPPELKKMPKILNIVAGTPLKVSKHPCMFRNGGCSDICISDGPTSAVCICSPGYVFSNKTNKICVRRSECAFKCAASGECLAASHRCDKKIDCLDSSDEANCENLGGLECDVDEFMCADRKKCILLNQRCDLNYNCDDHSDEIGCTDQEKRLKECRDHQIQCPSGVCLDITQRCDDIDD